MELVPLDSLSTSNGTPYTFRCSASLFAPLPRNCGATAVSSDIVEIFNFVTISRVPHPKASGPLLFYPALYAYDLFNLSLEGGRMSGLSSKHITCATYRYFALCAVQVMCSAITRFLLSPRRQLARCLLAKQAQVVLRGF